MEPVLDIVIVNWNSGHQLRDCVKSIEVADRTCFRLRRLVVVDNGSTDGSATGLSASNLPLILIQNKNDRGYGVAANQGALGSDADYLLFLNPDTRLFQDSVVKPIRFMERPENAGIGICGVQLLDGKGQVARHCTRFPRHSHFFSKAFGLDRMLPRFFKGYFMSEWNHQDSRVVDHVMGAFCLVRRCIFEKLDGFDEDFFLYLEDVDFSLRAMRAGWCSYYLADAQIYHKGAGTMERFKVERLFHTLQSRILYGYKHFGWCSATIVMLGTLLLEPWTRVVLGAIHRSMEEITDILKGYLMLWGATPSFLKMAFQYAGRVRYKKEDKRLMPFFVRNGFKTKKMYDYLKTRTRCPDCHSGPMIFEEANCHCDACGASFPIVEGRPVLISHQNEVFPVQSYLMIHSNSNNTPRRFRFFPSPSTNLSYVRCLKEFAAALRGFDVAYILVIGAGKQREWLDPFFSEDRNIVLVYSDIDTHAMVDIFCDGHDVPFYDGTFQGVIATAVLEHALYPEHVVSEMYRILASGGVIYSEIPFMQQVHEGAYDFIRCTLSGHRRLLNHFHEISSGLVAGPGTALVWAIENFALCFSRGRVTRFFVKGSTRVIFFWIKYFDYLFANNPQAVDGASCTYFLGKKEVHMRTSDKAIIERYVGANRFQHL